MTSKQLDHIFGALVFLVSGLIAGQPISSPSVPGVIRVGSAEAASVRGGACTMGYSTKTVCCSGNTTSRTGVSDSSGTKKGDTSNSLKCVAGNSCTFTAITGCGGT
jgi:hypothetical protein